jgi:hypothetical protein
MSEHCIRLCKDVGFEYHRSNESHRHVKKLLKQIERIRYLDSFITSECISVCSVFFIKSIDF